MKQTPQAERHRTSEVKGVGSPASVNGPRPMKTAGPNATDRQRDKPTASTHRPARKPKAPVDPQAVSFEPFDISPPTPASCASP